MRGTISMEMLISGWDWLSAVECSRVGLIVLIVIVWLIINKIFHFLKRPTK